LEAIFLSTFILISQNHETQLSERRNELDLQINLLTEQENTKLLRMLERIAEKVGAKKARIPASRYWTKPLIQRSSSSKLRRRPNPRTQSSLWRPRACFPQPDALASLSPRWSILLCDIQVKNLHLMDARFGFLVRRS